MLINKQLMVTGTFIGLLCSYVQTFFCFVLASLLFVTFRVVPRISGVCFTQDECFTKFPCQNSASCYNNSGSYTSYCSGTILLIVLCSLQNLAAVFSAYTGHPVIWHFDSYYPVCLSLFAPLPW